MRRGIPYPGGRSRRGFSRHQSARRRRRARAARRRAELTVRPAEHLPTIRGLEDEDGGNDAACCPSGERRRAAHRARIPDCARGRSVMEGMRRTSMSERTDTWIMLIAERDMGPADIIENRTFDEIAIGDSASLSRTLQKDDIALFAIMSDDVNP